MTQDKAIKTVDRIFNYCEEIDCHLPEDEQTGYKMYPDIIAVMEYIRNTPEIVKCENCIYYREVNDETYCNRNWWNDEWHRTYPDEYCSNGERKEGEKTITI